MARPELQRAAAHAVAAALCFALMGAAIKLASEELGNATIVFLRSLFGLLFLTPWLISAGARGLATRRLPMHLTRTGIGLCAMYCFFYALANLPLAEAMLLTYSTPLFIPLIAWLWIRERPPLLIFPLVLIGVLGIAMIIRPGGAGLASAAGLVGLCAGLLAAVAFVAIRRLSSTEPSLRIMFWFSVTALALSAGPALLLWTPPGDASWALMVLTGVLGSAGQYCLTRAYSLAPAARIAPLNYLVVVWAALIGWIFWSEVPDHLTATGSLLVILSGVLTLRLRQHPGSGPASSARPDQA